MLFDRGAAAVNLLVTSLVVANIATADVASAYFFVSSTMQVLVGPWAPAAEVVWLRNIVPFPSLRATVQFLTVVSALLSVALSSVAFGTQGLYLSIIGGVGSILYVNIVSFLASKHERPRAFAAVSVTAMLTSAIVKCVALVAGVPGPAIGVLLFLELWLLGGAFLVAGAVGALPRTQDDSRPLASTIMFVTAHFGQAALIVSLTALVLRLPLILPSAGGSSATEHTTAGLALQVLGGASLVSQALSTATAGTLRQSGQIGLRRTMRSAVAVVALVAVGYGLAVALLAEPALAILMPAYAIPVSHLLAALTPQVPALFLSGIALSVASVYGRVSVHLGGQIATIVVAAAALTVFAHDGGTRLFAWSMVNLLGAASTLAIQLWIAARNDILSK